MVDSTPPQRLGVVGAGMVGLATAWFLQERGVEVTVFDSGAVGAGSSWGNAGWLTPGLATPLPEPSVLRYGAKAVLSPASPVYVPPSADASLVRFLWGFARNSTASRWAAAMAKLVPINRLALESFDVLTDGGAAPTLAAASFLAAFRTTRERAALRGELEQIQRAGQEMEFEVLTGDQARALEPTLSEGIGAALRLHGQRYIAPDAYVAALAESVQQRGGAVQTGAAIDSIRAHEDGVQLTTVEGDLHRCDAVVIATGARLNAFTQQFGVRARVQAGRGYSFSVPVRTPPSGPIYLPTQRVACTPLGDRLRVAGMMEFRQPDAPLDQRRVRAIVDAARPLLRGVDLGEREDEWVGSRPCTTDGLPLIGVTLAPRVFVAGGHGMWGITLGPVTGRLLAEQITSGRTPAELRPFDPLR